MDLSPLLTSRTVAIIGLVCIALSALAALWAMVKLSYQRALGKPMPRNALTATLDVLAELAVNVVGAVSRALKLGTGESLFRATVPLTGPERGIALPAEKQGALDVSATRTPEPPHPTPADGVAFDAQRVALGAVTVDPAKGDGPSFDPHAHQTVVPPQRDDGQRGSVDLPGMVTFVVAVLLAGALLAGCPVVNRDPTIAPPPAPADAGTTTCHNGAPWRFAAGEWSQADRQCNRLSTDASAVVCCATPSALRPDASVHACVPMTLCSPEVSR